MKHQSAIYLRTLVGTFTGITLAGQVSGQSLIGCAPPTGMPAEDFLCLDDYATNTDLIWRSIGQVNFGNSTDPAFVPFLSTSPNNPPPLYVDIPFHSFYGDRLGYEASGLFDVDGDGFNDWSTTWYDARPVDKLTDTARVPNDAYVMPVIPFYEGHSGYAETAANLATRDTWNKVGMARVYSGRDNSQIGQELWSHRNHAIAPHEIGPLKDIDGDGRDELVLSANTYNGTRGGLYVMSYSANYNTPGDTTERWVCIMRISGQNSASEFAYELEDAQSDFNNDGQNDIVAASTFWRADGDRAGNTTGAGWIFLTPPLQVFLDIQASSTWPTDPLRDNVKRPLEFVAEDDYNLCVMQLDDATGMPIDVENDVPPGAAALDIGSIGDIADAGDLDGDGHNDFAVFGFYRYDDQGTEVTTGSFYFLLSSDGFGSAGYTLHDKQSSVIGITTDGSGHDVPQIDPNFDGVAVDVYQDAEVVFHGDANRGYSNNLRSYFRLNLDGTGSADMALVTYAGQYNANGIVDVLLDGQALPRFSPTGSIGSNIPPAGQRPLALFYYDSVIAPEYTFSGSGTYASDGITPLSLGNISGVNYVGDFDGDGDTELSIGTTKGYSLQTGNPNFSLINTVSVIDIPAVGGVPMVLKAVQHETPTYHAQFEALTGSSYGTGGMHYRGLRGVAAWDQDFDGRDDLLFATAATPQKLLQAPDPFGSATPVQLFDEMDLDYVGYRPYQIEGQGEGAGSTHVLLTPPSEPSLISGRTLYALSQTGNASVRIQLTVDMISPEIDPMLTGFDGFTFDRQFDQSEFVVELIATEQGAACKSTVVQANPTTVTGATAPRRFTIEFPMDGCSSSPDGMLLRIRSRWINDDSSAPGFGQPWITPVPPVQGIFQGGS